LQRLVSESGLYYNARASVKFSAMPKSAMAPASPELFGAPLGSCLEFPFFEPEAASSRSQDGRPIARRHPPTVE
jgi:hypothetical protein